MTSTILPLSEPFGPAAFREAGGDQSANDVPVVLIHGVGLQSVIWEPQLTALSAGRRVIALDMPGHGGSAPLARGAALPDFVSWLRAVLDALSLDRVHLAGHSMGALITGGFAIDHGDRLSSAALLNGVFRRPAPARQAVLDRVGQIEAGHLDLDTPLRRWFPNDPADDPAKDLAKDPARAKTAETLAQVDLAGYAAAYRAFAEGDATYADRFPDIACPLLAMTGDGDSNSTPEMSRAMAESVQDGRATVIKGHGHMMPLTAAAAVNAELARLFARAGATSQPARSDR